MILIECFTKSHIDNIAACLRLQPSRMIMLGNIKEMDTAVSRYQQLLKQKNLSTEIAMCNTHGKDLEEICATLEKLIQKAEDCTIDLTGGDELVIMAVGSVLAKVDRTVRQRIRVEKYDHVANAVRDCLRDNRIVPAKNISLTVKELIFLHGGKMHPDAYQPPKDCFPRDLDGIWETVSEAPKDWNQSISILSQFESRSESKMQVSLPQTKIQSVSNYREKETAVRDFLSKLHCRGVIHDQSSQDMLEYSYTSHLLRFCTQKAGNVLETKTLLEGRAVLENGAPFFQDCQMSVTIDWDGVIHKAADHVPDTRNEIDVVLVHGTTPLFISCKNGDIGEEELYKLNTVAERFGGPYAKKMLIATDLDRKSAAANRAFTQRAWDMDIFLVTDAADLSRNEWRQIFKQALQ